MNGFLVAACVVAIVAAVTDWKTSEIPNWLTLPALIIAPFAHIAYAQQMGTAGQSAVQEGGFSVLGAVLCALVPAMLYRQSAIGGGDLKLLAALGAILQTQVGIEAEMYGFIAAAVIAPAKLAFEGKLFSTLKNAGLILRNWLMPKSKQVEVSAESLTWFRMGPAIALGVIVTAILDWKK